VVLAGTGMRAGVHAVYVAAETVRNLLFQCDIWDKTLNIARRIRFIYSDQIYS